MVDLTNNTLSPHTPLKKALFLDRDGVVIDYFPYLSKPEQVTFPEGAGEALKKWQNAGYLLILITNQAGVGRGYFSLEDVDKVNSYIRQEYEKFGVYFDDVFICPHHPQDNCGCRKPAPEMLLKASKKHQIAMSESFFIGDAPSDLECSIRGNCQPILVLTGRGKTTVKEINKYPQKIPVFETLLETVKLIKK